MMSAGEIYVKCNEHAGGGTCPAVRVKFTLFYFYFYERR